MAAPEAIVDDALQKWGSSPAAFSPSVREAYLVPLRDSAHVHAICEEYRAAATLDREHDRASRANADRIRSPLLALWSAQGPLSTWYAGHGGPVALWRAWADNVQGKMIDGGHFFREDASEETANALIDFFGNDEDR
jgi:haloacetate dehalogenase